MYRNLIQEATDIKNPVGLYEVEEQMRYHHSTLDHLTRTQIKNLAKKALKELRLSMHDPEMDAELVAYLKKVLE